MSEMILNMLMWAMRMTGLTRVGQPALRPNYYDGPNVSIDQIESHLLLFTGGSVDLKKFDDGIATLCLNYYKKRNAMSGKMMVDFRRSISDLESWSNGRGVLVYGAGGTFCSGGDLQMARATANAQDGFKMAAYMHDTLDRFQRLPLLTVAVIEGTGALGGGAELALACDWRVAAKDALGIGMVHARMGVAPAFGGGRRLLRLLGRSRALDVLTRAKVIPPEEALALGLIDAVLSAQSNSPSQTVSQSTPLNSRRTNSLGNLLTSPESQMNRTESSYLTPDLRREGSAVVESARGERTPNVAPDADEDNKTLREAREWLREHLRAPPEVLRALKAMCDDEMDERRLFAPLWGGEAQMEALRRKVRHTS